MNAFRNGCGPSKSHPAISALIVLGNYPMNAFRKGFGPSKSHLAISALIVREMTLGMLSEKG